MHNYIEVLLGRRADGTLSHTLGSARSSVRMYNLLEHFEGLLTTSVCLCECVCVLICYVSLTLRAETPFL